MILCLTSCSTVVDDTNNPSETTNDDIIMLAQKYYWLILSVMWVALTLFVFFSVKQNKYNIGVLKSVGMPVFLIAIVYCATVFFVSVLSFILSLLGAGLILNYVNGVFSDTVKMQFHFYTYDFNTAMKTISYAGVSVILSIICICAYFITKRPVNLKRE